MEHSLFLLLKQNKKATTSQIHHKHVPCKHGKGCPHNKLVKSIGMGFFILKDIIKLCLYPTPLPLPDVPNNLGEEEKGVEDKVREGGDREPLWDFEKRDVCPA
jgi:hypothetical protein